MATQNNLYVPEELLAELQTKAAAEGKSVDELASAALRRGLEDNAWHTSCPMALSAVALLVLPKIKPAISFMNGGSNNVNNERSDPRHQRLYRRFELRWSWLTHFGHGESWGNPNRHVGRNPYKS